MLTGSEIIKRIKEGTIIIDPFNEKQINPNSYNLTLSNKLLVYDLPKTGYLDIKSVNPTKEIIIPEDGYILEPNKLYIGSTNEFTSCKDLIPELSGRSSIGRLGLCIHITAGFGDVGFAGKWTLEITTVHPIKVYPNIEICQIYYDTPVGDTDILYRGKYYNQYEPVASKMYKDFE